MEVYVLNKDLIPIGVVDNYNSFIWTERYAEAGDFELTIPASKQAVDLFQQDYYLKIKDSNELMIIETITIKTENRAQYMTVAGRSLVSILDRRVVLGTRMFNTAGQNNIEDMDQNVWQIVSKLVNENVVDPEHNPINEVSSEVHLVQYHEKIKERRKISEICISNSEYQNNTDLNPYGKITDKKPTNIQFNGENVYDAVKTMCDKYHLGFAISYYPNNLKETPARPPFVFYIYDGQNRSRDRDGDDADKQPPKTDGTYNTSVVLSPSFENITNISYASTTKGFKNIIFAIGDESENYQGYTQQSYAIIDFMGKEINSEYNWSKIKYADELDGLYLKEAIQDLSSEVTHSGNNAREGGIVDLDDEKYQKVLVERAYDVLNDQNKALDAFDGEIVNNNSYKVKEDYDLGDIIEMSDDLGHSKWMRVTEIIYSHTQNGYKIYPTLALYEKDQYEQRDQT